MEYLVRKVPEKAKDKEDAEIYVDVLLRNAKIPNSVGKTFTENEVGKAFVECMSILDPQPVPAPETKEGGSRGVGKSVGKG